MTNRDYVKYGGGKCPVCGGDNLIYTDQPDPQGSTIFVNTACQDCDSYWTEFFELDGYDNLYINGIGEPVDPEVD